MRLVDEVAILIGYMFSFGIAVILFATFLWAYFYNDCVFSVTINSAGEATPELVLLVVVMALSVYGLFRFLMIFKEVRKI